MERLDRAVSQGKRARANCEAKMDLFPHWHRIKGVILRSFHDVDFNGR
jgi:hypothetical protein